MRRKYRACIPLVTSIMMQDIEGSDGMKKKLKSEGEAEGGRGFEEARRTGEGGGCGRGLGIRGCERDDGLDVCGARSERSQGRSA